MDFLSNLFQLEYYTPYQRNIAKAMLLCYAPAYCILYLYEPTFKDCDLVSRLLFATSLDIGLVIYSVICIYFTQRLVRFRFPTQLFIISTPPITAILFLIITTPFGIGIVNIPTWIIIIIFILFPLELLILLAIIYGLAKWEGKRKSNAEQEKVIPKEESGENK